jgi:hypothetical protein
MVNNSVSSAFCTGTGIQNRLVGEPYVWRDGVDIQMGKMQWGSGVEPVLFSTSHLRIAGCPS